MEDNDGIGPEGNNFWANSNLRRYSSGEVSSYVADREDCMEYIDEVKAKMCRSPVKELQRLRDLAEDIGDAYPSFVEELVELWEPMQRSKIHSRIKAYREKLVELLTGKLAELESGDIEHNPPEEELDITAPDQDQGDVLFDFSGGDEFEFLGFEEEGENGPFTPVINLDSKQDRVMSIGEMREQYLKTDFSQEVYLEERQTLEDELGCLDNLPYKCGRLPVLHKIKHILETDYIRGSYTGCEVEPVVFCDLFEVCLDCVQYGPLGRFLRDRRPEKRRRKTRHKTIVVVKVDYSKRVIHRYKARDKGRPNPDPVFDWPWMRVDSIRYMDIFSADAKTSHGKPPPTIPLPLSDAEQDDSGTN